MNKTVRRRALGRGLSSLIPLEDETGGSKSAAELVDVNAIRPNPFQPRTDFAQEGIEELARSIQAQGLIHPIAVRKKVDGYEVISGERRLRAMKHLGWDQVPCAIRVNVADREMLELALVENLQREDLDEIEQATGYQRLLTECDLSHEQLSERVGKSRSAITNALRLLKLPPALQAMVKSAAMSSGHARALLTVDDGRAQRRLAERVQAEGLSVRQVEEAVRALRGEERPRPRKARAGSRPAAVALDADTKGELEELQRRVGTAVRVAGSLAAGRLEIHFSGAADLSRIIDVLLSGARASA